MTKYYRYVNSTNIETGKPTELALYHTGETVELANVKIGENMLVRYDNNTASVTSYVEAIIHDGKSLVIETLNTRYEFEELE